MHDTDRDRRPAPSRTRPAFARATFAVAVGLALLVAAVGPASGAPDAVAEARSALAAATAERQQAEARVRAAEATRAAATREVERLGQVDAELTEELVEARRELREYAIAAYIDGGQSEVFRSTLSVEQAQALAWQSSLLMGQSVSADEAAERYESLKEANEPDSLAAATEVDRADADLQEARFDLIQSAAFERDAEAALATARSDAERQEADRRAAAAEAAAQAAAVASRPDTASAPPRSVGGGRGGSAPSGSASPAMGNPTAAESATLARIRQCESRGNYSVLSPSGRYRGAYQFDLPTWRSVGGSGDPAAASPAEQDYRALLLLRMRGTRPWPNCGR